MIEDVVAVRHHRDAALDEADVDHLVLQIVGTLGEARDVVTWPSVTAEDNGSRWCVEAIGERREDRSMLHQDCSDPHTVLVERRDLDRLHDGCGSRYRRATCLDREIDVGSVVVVSHTDLMDEQLGGEVGARFVGDAHVDVVRKGLQQLLRQRANAWRRRVWKQHRHHAVGGKGVIGSPASPGP